jgi:DNA-binding beta-propeller fold protein YncE
MIRAQGTPAGGRWRFGATVGRVLGLALLVGVAGHLAPAWAQDELFVTNQDSNSVTVYFRTADGDVTPIRTLSGGLTGLSDPSGLFLDTVNKELFVANAGNDTVTVYPLNWTDPNTPPVRTLGGGLTGLASPTGLSLDRVNGELFVANLGNDSVTVYPRTWPVLVPNTAFLRRLIGGATLLNDPADVAVDAVHNELFVANFSSDSVTVYPRTWVVPNTAPTRTLSGASTGLDGPQDLDVDTVHGELFVANFIAVSVTVYPRTWPVLEPNTAFLRRLSGVVNTDLNGPFGLAVDTVHNELFVANFSTPSVTVYSRTASGDTGPTRTLSGGNTGLSRPQFVAVIVSAPIPTLSEWAQIGMAALLVLGGLLALRRRSGRALSRSKD